MTSANDDVTREMPAGDVTQTLPTTEATAGDVTQTLPTTEATHEMPKEDAPANRSDSPRSSGEKLFTAPTASASSSTQSVWSAASVTPLPEAPRRGMRVGSMVWALIVCFTGIFLIVEPFINDYLNFPLVFICGLALLGVILIVMALFTGRNPSDKKESSKKKAS